jgi:hypothetical protein
MEALTQAWSSGGMQSTTSSPTPTIHAPDPADVRRAVVKRSFATLATVSPAGRPHVAGVLYELVGGQLYVSMHRASRKARNVAADPHVAVCIPVRRVPVGPPSSIQFQAVAEILPIDDSRIRELVGNGQLKSITSHGELDDPGHCFVCITPPATIHTYGLGMSLRQLMREPLAAGGTAPFVARS